MPSLMIQPTRTEVTRSFPVLGFTVRTGFAPAWFEVAIATDPALFAASAKAHRSTATFYSSRAQGPLPAERGEAVYLVPQAVLDRFAGQEHLYYALAAYHQPAFTGPQLLTPPGAAAPSVYVSRSFTGTSRRLTLRPNRRGGISDRDGSYVDESPDTLTWGGDDAAAGGSEPVAGTTPAPPAAPASNGGGKPAAPAAPATPVPPAATTPAAPAHAAALDAGYDDGFGTMPEPHAIAAEDSGGGDAAADDSSHDIGGPIPDAGDAGAGAQALTITQAEYPQATRYEPADPGNYRARSGQRTINRVVIHITDGGSNINGTISWFKNPAARVSAHYVVGQNGEVVQMVAHNDVAWHAGPANGDSIGIEHVASRGRNILPTDAEYCASAQLVHWLCQQFNIPMDRAHVLGHSEADPRTTHTGCPNSVWDWNRYMPMVISGSCTGADAGTGTGSADAGTPADAGTAAQSLGATRALDAGTSFDINWNDVPLLAQTTDTNCWATAAAMVSSWAQNGAAVAIATDTPADWNDCATRYSLDMEALASWPISRIKELLETKGPLWVCQDIPGPVNWGFHAVVITGMYSDGAADGSDTYLRIQDPWDRPSGVNPGPHLGTHTSGSRYVLSFAEFLREFEHAATNQPGWMWVRFMHPHDTGARTIGSGAPATTGQSLGVAYGNGNGHGHGHAAHLHHAHVHTHPIAHAHALEGGQSYDFNWNDVPLLAQTTNDNCWAASAAMIAEWSRQQSVAIATDVPTDWNDCANRYGLVLEPLASFPIDQVRHMLLDYGPLWICADQPFATGPGFHAVVVTGMRSDGAPDGSDTYMRIQDPWDRAGGVDPPPHPGTHNTGSHYELSWPRFLAEYEDAVRRQLGWMWVRYMHAPSAAGRQPTVANYAPMTQSLGISGGVQHVGNGRPRGSTATAVRTQAAPAVVPVVSAIVGATVTRVLNNQGDISWELDQLQGVQDPWDNPANRGSAPFQTTVTTVEGPHAATVRGFDHIYADFEMTWEWNGRSLGNIRIVTTKTNDAVGAGLRVTATVRREANSFTKAGNPTPFAAIHVQFAYDFQWMWPYDDWFAMTDFTLYGDGSVDRRSRWTQS